MFTHTEFRKEWSWGQVNLDFFCQQKIFFGGNRRLARRSAATVGGRAGDGWAGGLYFHIFFFAGFLAHELGSEKGVWKAGFICFWGSGRASKKYEIQFRTSFWRRPRGVLFRVFDNVYTCRVCVGMFKLFGNV